ncbi:hypothetical protein BN1012_Phect2277 [Candidatus Phaeomarinobacter ectocarpi]|uniref:Uncharacterized protein n=1 Tax=Candidatus Phaeomarinibacter ectocarpi TaxID=1458461 RepID=X5MMJ8_9HYPH|nr:hypothetical protein BN1012_Phect2277 [Candidatus Phaeomarinobacter ectocarpi]
MRLCLLAQDRADVGIKSHKGQNQGERTEDGLYCGDVFHERSKAQPRDRIARPKTDTAIAPSHAPQVSWDKWHTSLPLTATRFRPFTLLDRSNAHM